MKCAKKTANDAADKVKDTAAGMGTAVCDGQWIRSLMINLIENRSCFLSLSLSLSSSLGAKSATKSAKNVASDAVDQTKKAAGKGLKRKRKTFECEWLFCLSYSGGWCSTCS